MTGRWQTGAYRRDTSVQLAYVSISLHRLASVPIPKISQNYAKVIKTVTTWALNEKNKKMLKLTYNHTHIMNVSDIIRSSVWSMRNNLNTQRYTEWMMMRLNIRIMLVEHFPAGGKAAETLQKMEETNRSYGTLWTHMFSMRSWSEKLNNINTYGTLTLMEHYWTLKNRMQKLTFASLRNLTYNIIQHPTTLKVSSNNM